MIPGMTRLALLFPLLLAPVCTSLAEPSKQPDSASLEQTLIKTYNSWRNSMIRGDFQAWQKHTAAYRRVVTRNNIVSQKLEFPAALFTVPIKPASIEGMKPIQARAIKRTGQLVFFGRIDVGIDLPEGTELPESLLILKFIKDGSVWKFNTLSLLNLNGADEIKAQIANEDYEFLNAGNFVPPGYVPLTPRECPVPDYVAQIQITSFGYDTVVTINGVSTHEVTDNTASGLIIGGLQRTSPSRASRSSPPGARVRKKKRSRGSSRSACSPSPTRRAARPTSPGTTNPEKSCPPTAASSTRCLGKC